MALNLAVEDAGRSDAGWVALGARDALALPAWVVGLSLVGVGGLFALLTADMLRRVPPAAVSTASGIAAAVQSLAYIASNPWVGQVKDTTGSYARHLVVLGAMVVPGVLVWILWPPPPPVATPREG